MTHKACEAEKLRDVALKNTIRELTARNTQLESQLCSLRKDWEKMEIKSSLVETKNITKVEECVQASLLGPSDESIVKKLEQKLEATDLIIDHLQYRMCKLEKR